MKKEELKARIAELEKRLQKAEAQLPLDPPPLTRSQIADLVERVPKRSR